MIDSSRCDETLKEDPPNNLAPGRSAQKLVPILMRIFRGPPFWIVMAGASCAFLVGLSVELIDRPVSSWVHEHLGDSRFAWFMMSYETYQLAIGPFSLMAGPSEMLRPLAIVVLAIIALATATGWRPAMRGRIILVLSLTILVATEFNRDAKFAFGRAWPESWLGNNQSWIRDGVFGFFPFHGGPGWQSFPSGHTTVISAPAAVLWVVWPKLRLLWAAIVVLVIAGLIGANYHFVSDTISGVYLGVAVGFGMTTLMLSPRDCLNQPNLAVPPQTEQNSPAIDASQFTPNQA